LSGPDPVQLDGLGALRRSHSCSALRAAHVGDEVVVAGWVHSRRDHGGVIFIDLRDASGLVQVVFRPDVESEAHARAHQIRSEFVIAARGVVERRSEDTINPNLPTGEIEISVQELRLLNTATPPPFPIEEEVEAEETVRLRHRIHDLRRPPLQRALRLRDGLMRSVRRTLSDLDFVDVETPVLAKATPEGARDFLVPSRMHAGQFYALPQSPQLLKQLLVIGGFERYYQIAHCFRDEDLRADRQFEFTQLDLEMAFVGVDDVLQVLEEVTTRAFADVLELELPRPFRRMPYSEAMERFGIDRPDTRIQLELVDLTDVFQQSEFRAFRGAVDAGGIVKCLPVHAADALSRGDVDRLESFAKKELGARGLAWVRVTGDGTWQSPIVKFFSDAERSSIAERTGAQPGSLLLFQADAAPRANAILARLRSDLGHRLGRMEDRPWDVLFVVEFPLLEREEDGTLTYAHMPFVAPVDEDLPLLETDPERVRGTHYDLIANGVELGSGSLRNHRSDVQRRVLEILGYGEAEMEQRFGFLLNSLDAGAPPHGGFAYGYDRLALLMAGGESLRDVIAFPKSQRGLDLFLEAPSEIPDAQLEELGLRVRKGRRS
jgi:aspartyl-tRNA synthetase